MNRKAENMVVPAYIIGTISVVSGAFLKIMHYPFSEVLLGLGLLCTAVFLVLALIEIQTSNKISPATKVLFTAGLLLLTSIMGLAYVLQRRHFVLSTQNDNK